MGQCIHAQIDEDSEYVRATKEIEFFHQFTKLYQREQEAMKINHDFSDSVIKKRQDELAKSTRSENLTSNEFGIKNRVAFLDLLLQATIDGQPLSNADIREEVDTFMFEGHDTTKSAISFCLYNLAMYPDIQQKVYEECENVLTEEESTTMSQMNDLTYLECVIKETLRLYPSVPNFGRYMSEEVTINGLTIAEMCNTNLSPFQMARDPEIFHEPLKFDPSRFSIALDVEKRNPYAYIPFAAGPRNCIGQRFAMLEIKSIISKIVKTFNITIAEEQREITLTYELVLRTKDPIMLKFNKRN